MKTPSNSSTMQAADAARFTRLAELFSPDPVEPRAQKVRQQLLRSRSRNGMLALLLHASARFTQGLPLSDLETNMLKIVRRCNNDDQIKQFGQIYQQLSAAQRSAFFPDEFVNLAPDTAYTQADFAHHLTSIVCDMVKQGNLRRVDISQLGADGRVPDDPDYARAVEQFGHGIIQFTGPEAPAAAPVAHQSRTAATDNLVATVRLNSFVCVKESSEWSGSCEPFFGSGGSSDLTPEEADQTTFRSQVFGDVDKNETHYFPANSKVFYGPFQQYVMVELEVWEKDQGNGWDTIRNALIEMSCACFSGACELVVTGGLAPVAAIFALAGIVTAILAGIFGSCDDDFQVNQSVSWDKNALQSLNGQSVTINYNGGGGTGIFDVRFDLAVSLDTAHAFVPPAPYPFPDKVSPILVNAAEDLAQRMLCVYQAPSNIIGAFNQTTQAMDSVVDNNYHSVVFDWATTTALDVLSIIAVMGPGAALATPKIYTGSDSALEYQGWNGSAWVSGPATPQNYVYWYRAQVNSAHTFYAKTYKQEGVADAPFSIYAFIDNQVPPAPARPFPFPDLATPVVAVSADDWGRQVLGANLPPTAMGGNFDLATSSMSSCAEQTMQVVRADWKEDVEIGAISIIGVTGPGAAMVACRIHGGNASYQGWNGTTWGYGVATPHNGIYWYRALVAHASEFYAKDYRIADAPVTGVIKMGIPFTIFAYLDSESLRAPVQPFPFADVVTRVMVNSADEWVSQVLAINQSPLNFVGNFDSKSRGVISDLKAVQDAGEIYCRQCMVVDWGGAATVGRTSILAVMGPSAAIVSLEIESPAGKLSYQGWNGSAWVDAPALEQNGVYWYRCVIAQATVLRAQTPLELENYADAFIVHAWLVE